MRPRQVLTASTTALVAPVVTLSAYLGVVTCAALAPARRRPTAGERRRFAILIPAHDEEAGIGRALDACARVDYPADLFAVHVVADNCSDGTAAVVRSHGVAVHERVDPLDPGKGPALNWLIDRVDDSAEPPDAFVVVDADTVLDPGFLSAMDAALANGADVAQGFYSVLESHGSTAAGLRAAALACRHHIRPLGRNRLGGSCGLYGNGMVFTRDVMAGRRWTGHLVEDAEFQMELLLDGIVVHYVPDAKLQAEMPDTLDGSTTQNQRWELGRIQMAKRYVPRLLRRIVGRSEATGPPSAPARRRACVDAIFDHLVPPLSVLVAADVASVGIAGLARLANPTRPSRWVLRSAIASTIVIAAHVLISLRAVQAPRSVYQALLGAPKAVAWKIGLWFDVFRSPTEVSWVRTQRNAEGDADTGSQTEPFEADEMIETER